MPKQSDSVARRSYLGTFLHFVMVVYSKVGKPLQRLVQWQTHHIEAEADEGREKPACS